MCFPKPSFLFLALSIPLLPALAAAQAPAPAFPMPVIHGSGSCEICHAVAKEDRLSSPAIEFKTDRHAEAGLGCADCHGGDPAKNLQEEAHAKSAGYIGVPQPQDIPDLCGRCHNNPVYMRTQNPSLPVDQEEKYWTSKHGQLLKMGLRKVAQCAACHPQEAEEFLSSRHADAASFIGPTPIDCVFQ